MFVGMAMCCGRDDHALRRALDFGSEGERRTSRLKRTRKKVEEKSIKVD